MAALQENMRGEREGEVGKKVKRGMKRKVERVILLISMRRTRSWNTRWRMKRKVERVTL